MNEVSLTDDSIEPIQMAVDYARRNSPFKNTSSSDVAVGGSNFIRGYLMQGVSSGQGAAMQVATKQDNLLAYKIDLAGVAYEFPDGQFNSQFILQFYANGAEWFRTDKITVNNLSGLDIVDAILLGAQSLPQGERLQPSDVHGWLGHPLKSPLLVDNRELNPAFPSDWQPGDDIPSKIGSWIIAFERQYLPTGFDVKFRFTLAQQGSVQLAGPAVITMMPITSIPNNEVVTVYDVLDIASPTPLRGGTLVVCAPFSDVGYGIIAANPREYLFTQTYNTNAGLTSSP